MYAYMYTCLSTVSCDVLIYFDSFPFFNMLHHLLLPRGDTVIAHCECQCLTLNELKVFQTTEGNPPGFPNISHLGNRKIIFKKCLGKRRVPNGFLYPADALGAFATDDPFEFSDGSVAKDADLCHETYIQERRRKYIWDVGAEHVLIWNWNTFWEKNQMCRHGFIYREAKKICIYIYIC